MESKIAAPLFQNLNYCDRSGDGLPTFPPSGLEHPFPQILGTLAAEDSHLDFSGIALGQRELPLLRFHSLLQGKPTSCDWSMHAQKAWPPMPQFWTMVKGIPAIELPVVLAEASVAIATTPMPVAVPESTPQ